MHRWLLQEEHPFFQLQSSTACAVKKPILCLSKTMPRTGFRS